MSDVQIFDAVRTPRGRGEASVGTLGELSPVALAATPLRALKERANLDTSAVGRWCWAASTRWSIRAAASPAPKF
ncbi:hypothetical protein Q4543_22005 [Salipiger sp. 1_MG-2023]|uniref:hypothetical protein n=1 Tax=Salipiger sp. 1_MG-2023 TaxID=3062665 RepID=UPI0026E3491D|nr:hypothetical protein [Salipiger sp. 1_MG-2023]MDO6588176.1 hypothetical protein [Salipiger sp. 1_MG-2023]